MLNQKEAEKVVDRLSEKLDGRLLKDMFASGDRQAFARERLTGMVESEAAKRKIVALPPLSR